MKAKCYIGDSLDKLEYLGECQIEIPPLQLDLPETPINLPPLKDVSFTLIQELTPSQTAMLLAIINGRHLTVTRRGLKEFLLGARRLTTLN